MGLVLASLSLVPTASSGKEDCTPPGFYASLPRDAEWFYGTAKDPDTDKAREHAIRNLGRQASGDIDGWTEADVDQLAGAGRDRAAVEQSVGRLLPSSTLLAGWEQDDFARCGGYSYVLVRIEKGAVRKFIKENRKFKDDLLQSLAGRVEKAEKNIAELKASFESEQRRVEKLESALANLAGRNPAAVADAGPDRESLNKQIVDIKHDISVRVAHQQIEQKLMAAEGSYAQLLDRLQRYDQRHQEIEDIKASRLPDPALYENLQNGTLTKGQLYQAFVTYRIGQTAKLHALCRQVLDHSPQLSPELRKDAASYAVISADTMGDSGELINDGEFFLKNYPEDPGYERFRRKVLIAAAAQASPVELKTVASPIGPLVIHTVTTHYLRITYQTAYAWLRSPDAVTRMRAADNIAMDWGVHGDVQEDLSVLDAAYAAEKDAATAKVIDSARSELRSSVENFTRRIGAPPRRTRH